MKRRIALGSVLALLVAGFALTDCAALGGSVEGARLERARNSPQRKDTRFENPQATWSDFWPALQVEYGEPGAAAGEARLGDAAWHPRP